MRRASNRNVMAWTFMGNTRMHQVLEEKGNKLSHVGIFTFEVSADGTISETGTSVSTILPYVKKWPHIKWHLTIMNHGTASIFTALRENTNGAQDTFISEIMRIIDKYPWCSGIDIDLECGGELANRTKANALFSRIYSTVKAKGASLHVNICLPGMTSVGGSVGGENWCVYADLDAYCDTAAIMSYGMSWAGSAPGPVSPRSWLEGIYSYAANAMNPDKIMMGLPGYGWRWQIYDTTENLGTTYRGTSLTYYAAKSWMEGLYNHTGDAPPQPFIPFFSYWDWTDMVPWGLLHVYDFMEGWDTSREIEEPTKQETYSGRKYLTTYLKQQEVSFGTISVDRDGVPDSYSGNAVIGEGYASALDEEAVLKYTFEVPTAGTYDVAVEIVYPRWDKNSIGISLDGNSYMLSESRLYFLYWRKKFWRILKSGVSLSAGKHTITVSGGVPGVVFYGFRVCSDFSQKATAGEVYYGLKPRKFMDVNGEMVQPDRAFKVTAEVLRRKPESALVWYEDFCDYSEIPTSYFTVLDGSWKIWKDESSDRVRKYSQLEGSGKLALDYTGFSEIHVRARFAFKSSGGGKAGVFLGSVFCCINYDTQCVELYQGSKKLGSYASSFSKTSNADLRSDSSLYTVEMRIRGNKVRVYSGAAYTLRFTATITAETGYVGFMAEKGVVCDLLRLGDAWYYEPYECFDITFPDGKQTTFGRCTRTGISWDNEFELFRVNSDVEEISTRSQDISMDYDFFHSHEMSLECGNDYEMKVVPHDLNVWLSRMYLGDADGFSIMYYSDVDSIVYWANEAAYTYGVSGIAIWSLGQEDMRLWDSMPDQI